MVHDPEKLIDVRYWVGMGAVSVIGVVPVTAGFLSQAFNDLIAGAFISALVWLFGYLLISRMMDEVTSNI